MYYQIEQILSRYGYEGMALNVADIHLALRQEQGQGFAVVTLDETGGNQLSAGQFYHVSEQIREFLKARGCYQCRFLYLLVSGDDQSISRLFQDDGSYWHRCLWRIDPDRGQVMVYEDADEAFMVLRAPLESLFALHTSYGSAKEQAPQEIFQSSGGDLRPGSLRNRKLPWCNIVLILLNVAVFLYTDLFLALRGDEVMDAGALGWQQVFGQGEWYRMATSMFLHSGSDHIFNNMLVLAYMGSCLEFAIGSLRYGILYIGSGLLAGFTSMVYNMVQNDYTVSVGASGAIFGTVGAMLFLLIFHKGRRTQYSAGQIAWMAFLSLYGGIASQGVDNAAHFGGFVAGFLLAGLLTLTQRPDR